MTKQEFLNKVSKIDNTFEDEFRAEFNSPELIWEKVIKQLLIQRVSKSFVCDEEDKKTICNNPLSHECCNKHHKRI